MDKIYHIFSEEHFKALSIAWILLIALGLYCIAFGLVKLMNFEGDKVVAASTTKENPHIEPYTKHFEKREARKTHQFPKANASDQNVTPNSEDNRS